MTTTEQTIPTSKPRHRRMARVVDAGALTETAKMKAPSRLDQVELLLLRPEGASIAELMAATGWQPHSLRGAIAGALKRRGLIITSTKDNDVRCYRASRPA